MQSAHVRFFIGLGYATRSKRLRITDLGNATLSKPRLFAYDTCLVFSNSSLSKLEDNCNKELDNLKKWCNANKLKINPEKSAVVLVPPKFNLQTGKFDVT